MLKKLYDRCVELARHKFSKPLLGLISFIESSFFPIPPDVMIVPMVIAKKEDYIKIFLIATIFSSIGGLLGYFIGSFFLDFGITIVEFYGYEEKVFTLQEKLSSDAGILLWLGTLFLAGFTPLPFKVFTITSGIIGFNLIAFFLICLFSRGLRFFIVAYFSKKYGHKFEIFLEKKGAIWFGLMGGVVILIAIIMYFLIK
jgi:membrane protein YqaA with SNARE-associated domain